MRIISLAPPKVMKRFFAVQERAREIDPEAFRPLMLPHFSGSQLHRQEIARAQAEAEMREADEA